MSSIPELIRARTQDPSNFRELGAAANDREAVLKILAIAKAGGDYITFPTSDSENGVWHAWDGRHHAATTKAVISQKFVDVWIDGLVSHVEAEQKILGACEKVARIAKADKVELDADEESALAAFRTRTRDVAAYAQRVCGSVNRRALGVALRDKCSRDEDHFDGAKTRGWTVMADGKVMDLHVLRTERRVQLNPPDHRLPNDRTMGAKYDPGAKADVWKAFLDSSLPDPEQQRYIQAAVGAAFLGDPSAKCIPHLVGPANCGKSTLLKGIRAVFGGTNSDGTVKKVGGYGGLATGHSITDNGGGQNFERDAYRGKRFVMVSEPDTAKVDDPFLKSITGGEPVRSGKKGRDFTEWLPECVVFIAANEVIKINTKAKEVIDRVNVVRFPNKFEPRGAGEVSLDAELMGELDGIFNWVLDGVLIFIDEGVVVPDVIRAAQEDIADEDSAPRRWFNTRIESGLYVLDPDPETFAQCLTTTEAFNDYKDWARDANELVGTRDAFSRDVQAKIGKANKKSNGAMHFYGLQLAQQDGGRDVPDASAGSAQARGEL